MKSHRLFWVPVILGAVAACGGPSSGWAPQDVAVPAAEGSGEPHLAVADDGRVVLSWVEPHETGHALQFSTLQDGSWSAPANVAQGEHWFVNWADFPSVMPIAGALWAAHWLVRQPEGGYAYDVAMSLSTDGGSTWGPVLSPHDDATATEHGFATLFPWQGGVGVVWLDGREMATRDAAGHTGHGEAGSGMTLRSAVISAEGTVTDGRVVDGLTCDCCQTDVAALPGGPLVVYRDRSEEEVRDIAVASGQEEGWSDPRSVHADAWRIDGCPVNGPAVDATPKVLAVAWFTGADDRSRVRVAFSSDDGRTYSTPAEVDETAPLGRVDVVMLNDTSAAVSWLRPDGENAAVAVRRVARDGGMGAVQTIARTGAGRPSGFPQMVRSGQQLVFAWTETGPNGTRVRSAVADVEGL